MAKITEIPRECPQCGGPVWDNTKREKKNPKAPDAACKDKDHCRWAGWLPEGPKGVKTSARGPQQYPWATLLKLCVQYTQKEIAPLLGNTTDEDVIYKYAYTIFSAAKENGGDIFKKAAPAPAPVAPPPPPPPPASEYDDGSEDGLPF